MALSREQVVQTAEKFVARGKIEAAIREYKKVLAENPNDANTLNRVGDLYARIQRIDEAVDFFNQIAAQYTSEGFFVKAIAIYKKIIKLNPTHLEVYERLAELYHKQGLVNEARTQYQVLADYYMKHENPTSAIAMYQKMAEVEPENPTYHVKLAELYHQQKLTEKAMGEYRVIAELMLEHGHAQEAEKVYERALDVDAGNVPFITDAVLKLREGGYNAAAARFLAFAIERNPEAERVARLVGAEGEAYTPEAREISEIRAGAAAAPAWGAGEEEPEVAAFAEAEPAEPDESLTTGRLGIPRDLFDSQPLRFPDLPDAPAASLDAAYPEVDEAPAPRLGDEEIELDLDEVFVLDMESEEEPASLVRPPADMLGDAPRRPAWAQTGDEPAAAAAAAAAEIQAGEAEDFELPGIEIEMDEEAAPAWPEPEVDLEPGLELGRAFDAEAGPAALPPFPELPPFPVRPTATDEADRGWDGGELELDLDAGFEPLPELAAPAEALSSIEPIPSIPPEPPPPIAPAPSALQIDPDLLERTAAELHPQIIHQREEDLVTEAEVLAKYGLEEKALERLREALKINSRHLAAHALAIQLHLDKGRHSRVVEVANQMAKAAAHVSDREPWLKMRRKLLTAGYRLDGDQVLGGPASVAAASDGVDDLLRGLLKDSPKTPAARRERPKAVPPPAPPAPPAPTAPPAAPPAGLAGLATAATVAAAPPPAPPPVPASPMASPPISGQFNLLEIGAMVESEDLDSFDDLPLPPPRPAVPLPPPPAAAPPPAPGLDDTGMSWLDEAEAGRGRQGDRGGKLFAEEDDFFDLAGELEQELSREEGIQGSDLLVQPAEQSLEQIVEGFKKGVAENLSPTDFDTHFNLGIAYREMGLLDEAIGEFQLASKSPHLLVPCCSMLGLCFLDKGLPELAIKWYRRGLESPNVSEDDSLGLLYDMGNVYDTLGDADAAYKTFVEIYGINTNYRDVVARIEELGRGR